MPNRTLTAEGLEKLKGELAKLKTVDRPETIKRMAAARELGDLSENADYHDAREQLAFIEGRIEELEALVKHAEVVSTKASTAGTIQIGSTVTVTSGGTVAIYEIVGSSESDSLAGKISAESPVGSALIEHRAGESVDVQTPSGIIKYTIKKVE